MSVTVARRDGGLKTAIGGPQHFIQSVALSLACGWIPVIFMLWLALDPNGYAVAASEDNLIETGGALLFGLAGVLFVIAAKRSDYLASRGHRIAYAPILLLAFGCVVLMGEELSWGQRFFGFTPPESMQVSEWRRAEGLLSNIQNEVNLHNMAFVETTVGNWRVMLAMFFGFGLLAPLAMLAPPVRRLARRLCIPVAPLAYWPLPVLSYLFLAGFKPLAVNPNNVTETVEMLLAALFVLVAAHGALRPDDLFRANRDTD